MRKYNHFAGKQYVMIHESKCGHQNNSLKISVINFNYVMQKMSHHEITMVTHRDFLWLIVAHYNTHCD